MDLKKSKQANLEVKRTSNFIIGIIITLSLILISFEWTSSININTDLEAVSEIIFEEQMIQITRREEPKPEPKPELPKIMEVINIMPDDVELEDVVFDVEVTDNTWVDYVINVRNSEEVLSNEDEIFVLVEDMPLFNGENPDIEFTKYIARNVKYPKIALDNGVSGRVFVQFVIDPHGNLVDAKIVRSVDPALDKEALRVVTSSPKWTPGKQRNKAVKVSFTFPIRFALQQ